MFGDYLLKKPLQTLTELKILITTVNNNIEMEVGFCTFLFSVLYSVLFGLMAKKTFACLFLQKRYLFKLT